MYWKRAKAVRRKAAWLVKGKLQEFVGLTKMADGEYVIAGDDHSGHVPSCESAVVENVLLYWVRDLDCYKDEPAAMLAGYECGAGGIGRCFFSIWWVDSDGKWEIKVHACCPPILRMEMEDLIEEVNNEKNEG